MKFYPYKEVFDGLDEGDIGRYYNGMILPIKDENGVHIVTIDSTSKRQFTYHDAKGNRKSAYFSKFEWPMGFNFTGYINANKHCIYIARIARRQWRKGLNQKNTSFSIPFENVVAKYFVGYHKLAQAKLLVVVAPLLQELVDKKDNYYPPYEVAYNKLKKGEAASVAIAPEFAIAIGEKSAAPLLLKANVSVGWAHADHVILPKRTAHLWQQINFTDVRGE